MDHYINPTDDIPQGFPVLLRFARKTYSWAIRGALTQVGFDDLPKNGVYVLIGIEKYRLSMTQLISQLGLTKQAASKLVDLLVSRGYVTRETSSNDRRQLDITPSDKGLAAVELIKEAIDRINNELVEEVGEDSVKNAKYVLAVLMDINDRHHDLPRGIQ